MGALVDRGNCVVGCTLTESMLEICEEGPPPGCTQNSSDDFYYKTNKKGKDIIKSCAWLEKKTEKKMGKIWDRQVKHLAEGDVTEPAQDVCQKSCDSCDACYQNNRSRFFNGKYKEDGSPVSMNCKNLKKKAGKKKKRYCSMTELDVYGPAREVCPKTCEIGDC